MKEREIRYVCDCAVQAASETMQIVGAPVEMILDRLLTFAGAQACVGIGAKETAAQFRLIADRIEAGAFDALTGEGVRH